MKRIFISLIIILVTALCSFASPTSDLLKAVKNENSMPEDVIGPIRQGAELNHIDRNGWTPLDWAAMNPNPDVLYTLLKEGDGEVDINMQDEFGNTVLMKAAYYNYTNPEVTRILIDFGARIDIKNDKGQTALDFARTDEIAEIIKEAMK